MEFTVSVHCVTYNHSAFINDAMNGFCNQITTFPYVCVIVDDASTDGEDVIINKYLEDNFDLNDTDSFKKEETDDYRFILARNKKNTNCLFAVYFLKYNHFRENKSKDVYFKKWYASSKYIALCEGDDYWVSPDKLQRQVSFMEENSSYSMTCHRVFLLSVVEGRMIGENYCYSHNRAVSIKDIIYRTGLFISTCSILYRKGVYDYMPDYWRECLVGDYPLQIACALKGDVWYCNEVLSVYRIDNPASWTGSQEWGIRGGDPKKLRIIQSQVRMFEGFGRDYPKYQSLFYNKAAEHINKNIPLRRFGTDKINDYLSCFSKEISRYNLRWKIDLLCRKTSLPLIRTVYQILFTRQFLVRNKMYK